MKASLKSRNAILLFFNPNIIIPKLKKYCPLDWNLIVHKSLRKSGRIPYIVLEMYIPIEHFCGAVMLYLVRFLSCNCRKRDLKTHIAYAVQEVNKCSSTV